VGAAAKPGVVTLPESSTQITPDYARTQRPLYWSITSSIVARPQKSVCLMSQPFDPYRVWLGIQPKDQPADHYRLLGIERFEDQPQTIDHAADRQMAHLRTFQSGRHADQSQRILNEVAAARVCLMDAAAKAAYDQQLQESSISQAAPIVEIVPAQPPPAAAPAAPRAAAPVVNAVPLSSAEPPLAPPPSFPPVAAPATARPGAPIFGDYVLLEEIGDSRTGKFFKAQHQPTGRMAALKMLSDEAMADREIMDRFHRKIEILALLKHPNLVEAYDAGQINGASYLATEYVDGQDLRRWCKQFHPLPVDYVVNYIMQAASGLGYAHSLGIYHRNVKPGNILVDHQGIARVIGLGLARLSEAQGGQAELTTPGRVMGTVDYMAPEQAVDSSGIDHRADIYSLGCTLYLALTGKRPYQHVKSPMKKILAHRSDPIPSLLAERNDVSLALDAVYQRMMAKTPETRFQSMGDVISALQAG